MISRKTIMVTIVITSLSFAIASTGCTRVYQTTMEEMTETEHERLAARAGALRECSVLVRDAVQQSTEQVRIAQTTADERRIASELEALDLSMQRLQLHVWNLRRHIASVRDVGNDDMRLHTDESSLSRDRYQAMLADLYLAHDASQRLIDGLAVRRQLLSADSSERRAANGEDSNPPRQDPTTAAATASESIDHAIQSVDAFLGALTGGTQLLLRSPTIEHTLHLTE